MRKQQGLSLVELMISITLGLILMTGVVKIFVSSKVVFGAQQSLSRIQETGRLGIEFLSRDISAAGYYGCHRPVTDPASPAPADQRLQGLPLVIGGLHGNFGESIRGYASINNLPQGITMAMPGSTIVPVGPNELVAPNVPVTANILVVRTASPTGWLLNSSNGTTPTFVSVASNAPLLGNCAGNLCIGSAALVADCHKSFVFQVTGLNQANATTLNVTHPGAWGTNYRNTFYVNAELLPFNTTVYFLARRNGNPGTPSSLYQRTNNGPAIEVLEGVEQMRVTYARSVNNQLILPYQPAELVTDAQWPTILSVRVELVVRSQANNVLSEPQQYRFAGTNIVPAETDRHMRQVFTTNIAIRNRLNLR